MPLRVAAFDGVTRASLLYSIYCHCDEPEGIFLACRNVKHFKFGTSDIFATYPSSPQFPIVLYSFEDSAPTFPATILSSLISPRTRTIKTGDAHAISLMLSHLPLGPVSLRLFYEDDEDDVEEDEDRRIALSCEDVESGMSRIFVFSLREAHDAAGALNAILRSRVTELEVESNLFRVAADIFPLLPSLLSLTITGGIPEPDLGGQLACGALSKLVLDQSEEVDDIVRFMGRALGQTARGAVELCMQNAYVYEDLDRLWGYFSRIVTVPRAPERRDVLGMRFEEE